MLEYSIRSSISRFRKRFGEIDGVSISNTYLEQGPAILALDKGFGLCYHIQADICGCAHLCGCSSMVESQPSKLVAWVRFPSPAPRRCKLCITCSTAPPSLQHLENGYVGLYLWGGVCGAAFYGSQRA